MITGCTRLVGVIGNPVGHSLSPVMHNSSFAALGMDWVYVPLHTPQDQMEAAVRGLTALGFQGANVTVPYKEKVIPYLDGLSADAAAIGAVNTIVVSSVGQLMGHNTDWRGFLRSLERIDYPLEGKRAVVIGVGGAARAVAYALADAKCAVTFLARDPRRGECLARDLAALFPDAKIGLMPIQYAADVSADLIVNTTPVGMIPEPDFSPWPDATLPSCELIYDLIYNPKVTMLMKTAMAQGIRVENGMRMLVEQAAAAFELWTSIKAPVEVMADAVTLC